MAETTLSELITGRRVSSGTPEERVNKFKSDVKKGFSSALSGLFGKDTKKPKAAPKEKAAPAKAAPAKAAPKAEPAKAKSDNNGRGDRGGRSGELRGVKPRAPEQSKRSTTNVGAEKKPPVPTRKPAKETVTSKKNKASAERRKMRRKSDDSKFDFAGAINRQLTGR